MFKPNTEYIPFDILSNRGELEECTSVVVEYPENKLPELFVPSDFGDCLIRSSDLYDLFNQERILSLGADGIRDYLSRYVPKSSQFADALSKIPDDQLMDTIKSRHIQTYSELMSWSKYFMYSIEDKLADSASEPASEPASESASESSPKS